MCKLSLSRRISLAVGSVVAALSPAAFGGVEGYYRQPTIHGDSIVFNCEGDLWRVPAAGGTATRMTSHPANEAWPEFSPDGKWLAFTADYQGNSDVYIMPAEGGEPKRLSFHPVREDVVGWTPDSKSVIFRCRRTGNDSLEQLYTIDVEGGEPKQVPVGRAGLGSYSQDGNGFVFIRNTWFSNWKRYKGGTAPQLWVGDFKAGKFKKITEGPAVHNYPMWVGDRIFYTTETDGNLNLFSSKTDGTDEQRHSKHADYDVRFANTDGNRVVYTVGCDVWTYDIKAGQNTRVPITLSSDRIRSRPRAEDASKTLERWELNDDGKRVLLGSRGDLWIAPAKPGGRIVQLANTSASRERAATFSPDGTRVACITDESGEQEIKILDVAGKVPPRVLTKMGKGWIFQPEWSPDGKNIAFADLDCNLYVVDVESGEVKKVDQDPVWEIRQYTFSPDGKWLAYVKNAENRTTGICLYNLADGTNGTISSGFTSDSSPVFDPSGKYLYFLSQRFWNPILDEVDREFVTIKSTKPCLAILTADGKSPFLPEEMLEDDKKDSDKDSDGPTTGPADEKKDGEKDGTASSDDEKKDDDKDTKADKKKKPRNFPEMRVDLQGISDRIVELPNVKGGSYAGLAVIEGKVFFIDRPLQGMNEDEHGADDDAPRGGALLAYSIKDKKAEPFLSNVTGYTISLDGKKLAWRAGGAIKITDTSKASEDTKDKVDLSALPLMVTTSQEWQQIFHEAWRLQRDFYWAANMVGVNWQQARDRYAYLLPRIGSRGELNDLVGQLIGELGTSHTYIYGGDANYQPPKAVPIGLLGADIDVEESTGLHRFAKVFRPEKWETDVEAPLTMSHANIKDGEYLLAMNGQELAPTDSVDERLANLAGVQVLLTVCTKADKSDARDVQVKTLKADFELKYADLCRRNREYVSEKSSGRIGYFHIPDMSGGGLVAFVEGFYPQFRKDALVVDVRNNHGGFVSQMLLERLGRKAMAFGKARRGIVDTYPECVHLGPKICLIDQNAGSDGDIFPYNFRNMGLGKLVGKRSWGGVVGIRSDKGFVDAGMSTQPEFAFWDTRGGWTIEGHGVDPDIEVEMTPEDEIAGRDPQMDRAIEELIKELNANPGKLPVPPQLPVRAGPMAGQNGENRDANGERVGAPVDATRR